MPDQPRTTASIRLTLHASGLDRHEAAHILRHLPPGANLKASVHHPGLGSPRCALQITDLSIVGLAELAETVRLQWATDLTGEDTPR